MNYPEQISSYYLNPTTYDCVEAHILGEDYEWTGYEESEGIRPQQTKALLDHLGELSVTRPETILFTADSAIPLADIVRGIYEANGTPLPDLNYIRANKRLSYNPDRVRTKLTRAREIKRLKRTIGDKVLIVDQFVSSGYTLRFAADIARDAGARKIATTDSMQVYAQAQGRVDRRNVTSVHAARMREIGHRAAQCINSF